MLFSFVRAHVAGSEVLMFERAPPTLLTGAFAHSDRTLPARVRHAVLYAKQLACLHG